MTTKQQQTVENEYTDFGYMENDSGRDRIKDKISYTPKYRGYSFSSLSSRKNSIHALPQ